MQLSQGSQDKLTQLLSDVDTVSATEAKVGTDTTTLQAAQQAVVDAQNALATDESTLQSEEGTLSADFVAFVQSVAADVGITLPVTIPAPSPAPPPPPPPAPQQKKVNARLNRRR